MYAPHLYLIYYYMIYFDNAATTFFKPKEVINAVTDCLERRSFNANRGTGSKNLELDVLSAREKLAAFVGAKSRNVVFCAGCTAALNIAILGGCKKGGHVVTTLIEHNSVLRPLKELERKGIISLTFLPPGENGIISPESVLKAVRQNTYMVVLTHVSNVTGYTQDLAAIGGALFPYKICFVVDGAQSVGYLPVNMEEMKISMLCLPAHKGLHAVQGLGALCFDENFAPQPITFGGTGSDSANLFQPQYFPDRLESGTQNAPGIMALSAAIDWWESGKDARLANIAAMQEYLQAELQKIDKVKVYSVPNKSGIVSFAVGERDSNEIGDILLEEYGIATRSGLHCAPLMHYHLGTLKNGLVRASLSGENTFDECAAFLEAVKKIAG